MDLSLVFFAAAIPAMLISGISKGGFAGGAAFSATPLLALVMPPDAAVGLMLTLLVVMDITAIPAFWRQCDWAAARVLMLTALPGLALGWFLFRWAEPDVVRVALGLISLGFVAFQLAKDAGRIRGPTQPIGLGGAVVAGALSGFTSFVSHAGGPPASIYLLSRKLEKGPFQATMLIVFFWINILKLPPFMTLGLIRWETLWGTLALAPVAILGTRIGVWMHHRVPERPYFLLIYIFLTITGVKLLWDGLT